MRTFTFSAILGLIVVLTSFQNLTARSTGITGRTTLGSQPGCTCHSATPSSAVKVTISGPQELQMGAVATFQVTVEGGPLSAAGVNIAASDGSLQTVDNTLKVVNGELTHPQPQLPDSGRVVFAFSYTAPQNTGSVILAATANSVNRNGSNSGDAWNHAPDFTITVTGATDVAGPFPFEPPSTFELMQNFPNPFNPQTTIPYYLAQASRVYLYVTDAAGRKVAVLVNGLQPAGRHQVQLDARNLPSGLYFYHLIANGRKAETRKMLLIR